MDVLFFVLRKRARLRSLLLCRLSVGLSRTGIASSRSGGASNGSSVVLFASAMSDPNIVSTGFLVEARPGVVTLLCVLLGWSD